MALTKIKHVGGCENTAFYMPALPVGRGIQIFDPQDAVGVLCAKGNIVECESCEKKVDLAAINDYYELGEN